MPPGVRARIEELAASSDVLVLGELHGTREVPRLAAGLLASLNERGYHVLAIEAPDDAQAPLMAWARGETDRVPDFFANPSGDGRASVELLELIRIAVSAPFRWRVVCFDEREEILDKRYEALIRKNQQRAGDADLSSLTDAAAVSLWREGDAAMAMNLLREAGSLKSTGRILAICGNLHARTRHDTKDPVVSRFWPSFAATLKQRQPAWRVNSVDIAFSGGAHFNEGKVRTIRGRPIEHAEVRSAGQSGWDLVLTLPEASPARFLSPNARSPEGRAAGSRTGGP